MNKLENILAYFYCHYPFKRDLSKTRLTKLVYLVDWFSSLLHKKQMTNIKWIFNHCGPHVDDVIKTANDSKYFKFRNSMSKFGEKKICYQIHWG